MSIQILVDENIPAVEHYLDGLGTVRRINGRELRAADLKGIDALLVRSVTRVDEALLRDTPVRFVGTATSGVDHIDRDYLQRAGIGFSHAPGSNANSVVEYVLAAIAAVQDKLERVLSGGSVGIVGYGYIGKAVAARLGALGIHYRVYDPWLEQSTISNGCELADVLDCDVLTLHAELTREQPWPSFHLLGEDALGTLRSDSLLINASRGPVVDNRALLNLLQRGSGPLTVLDVWESEPAIDSQLLQLVRLGSAHIAGYSLDGKLLATRMLCEALAAHMGLAPPRQDSPAGQPPALLLSGTPGRAQTIRQLLGARYDITRDDALLRQVTLGNSAEQAAAGFDQLRKHYTARRELQGSLVNVSGATQVDLDLLHGLGCELTPESLHQ